MIKDQFLPETLAEVVNDQFHGSHRPFAAEPQQQPESHVDGEADQAENDQLGEDLIGAEKALSQLDAFAKANFRGHQLSHHHKVPGGCDVDSQGVDDACLLYTSPSPRDVEESRMPSSA